MASRCHEEGGQLACDNRAASDCHQDPGIDRVTNQCIGAGSHHAMPLLHFDTPTPALPKMNTRSDCEGQSKPGDEIACGIDRSPSRQPEMDRPK
jgi:hypothetical protein